MATKRGPQSFMKRQRELQKQQAQRAKTTRRQERNAAKKDAKLNGRSEPERDVGHLYLLGVETNRRDT